MSPEIGKLETGKRTVCDHCRRRRIRCDGSLPCSQCNSASLSCKREHIAKRRGPKRGNGRVIDELRAREHHVTKGNASPSSEDSFIRDHSSGQTSFDDAIDHWVSSATTSKSIPFGNEQWHPNVNQISHMCEEPESLFSTDQFRPHSANYFSLIPTCFELFMEHIYPIMPLIHMSTIRSYLYRALDMSETNLLYSLCALTATHMIGQHIPASGDPPCWESVGRFFLDECLSARQSYDFVEDKTLSAVISSYFVSTAFFELNQSRKSWYYLREAMTLGQDLGLHDEKQYIGLNPIESLCRRRTFWILYVTERSFAILRHKPLTLSKTPDFPKTLHDYETPQIHSGFMHLVQSYHLLDSAFVDSWNGASEAQVSTTTYTALQQRLNLPHPSHLSLTNIQKADILVTQHWLRLIVWQSSMRQGLLSSTAEDDSMTFRYPLKIAHSLLSIISSLPETSIEVHGMGIFEKIFEIGNTMLDVMQACGNSIPHELYGITQDPFQMFVKTLSQTPNSQKQYANLLLAKAAEKPEIQRFTNAPMPTFDAVPLGGPVHVDCGAGVGLFPARGWRGSIVGEAGIGLIPPQTQPREFRGSIVGEISDEGVDKSDEQHESTQWNDNTILITDDDILIPGIWA